MPLYEYRCSACSHDFTELVTMARAEEPQPCPSCGSRETEKRISTVNTSGCCSSGPSGTPFR